MKMIQENLEEVAAISTAVNVDIPITELLLADESSVASITCTTKQLKPLAAEEMTDGNVKYDCDDQANFASVVDTPTSTSSLQQQNQNELDKKTEGSVDMLTLLSPENFV
jgi:spore coat protein CotH